MPVHRPEPHSLLTAALALAGMVMAHPAADAEDTPQDKLHGVEQQIDRSRSEQAELSKQADALAVELAALRADTVAIAKAAQAHEAMLSELEGEIRSLSADEAQKRAAVERDRGHEAELLAALARLARNPPEALALGPETPTDAIRSGLLLGAAVPQLQAQAATLRLELDDLRRLHAEIARKREATKGEQQALNTQRQRLETLVQRKAALRDQALQHAQQRAQRLVVLSAQAGNLHDLIQRLDAERKAREAAERKAREEVEQRAAAQREAERKAEVAAIPRAEPGADAARPAVVTAPAPVALDPGKPKTIRPFAKARGAMVFPASGELVRRYGDPNEFGVPNKGLIFETRAGALVVAPFDGRIEFAGPFKGYGQILIIEHGDGYHSLLAGLDRIDGTVGDRLVAGEPVGTMSSDEPKPRLYLELRHDGQPINPLPWLATHDEKVSG